MTTPGPATTFAVVTPSFQQARFLGHAIDSVLAQGHPGLDYLVVDGGSTDGSLDVLRGYGGRVRWTSERDGGQADAIARGFAETRGEILAWVNSDDALAPGALAEVEAAFAARPDAGLVYGDGALLDAAGEVTGPFPWIEPFDLWRLVHFSDYILQPAAFFRRSAYAAAGGLDTTLHYAMDWDLWIRLAAVSEVVHLPGRALGYSRVWEATKTATGGWRRIAELSRLARRHAGRRWTPAVQRYALDTLGNTLRRRLPRWTFRLAVAIGVRVDAAILRRLPVHADGWLGPRGRLLFPRRWGAARLRFELPQLPASGVARIEVRVDGRVAHVERCTRIGELDVRLAAPAGGSAPFCDVEVRSDFALRDARTRRRLSLRLVDLTAATPA